LAKNIQPKVWQLADFNGRRYSTNTPPGGEFVPLYRINFDGLSDGQSVVPTANDPGSVEGKRFTSCLGDRGFYNGFGIQATTAVKCTGKTSSCALSIKQGSDGDPAGGSTGANTGAFGGIVSLGEAQVLEGEEIWWAMRIMFPLGFDFTTPNPVLKYIRLGQWHKDTHVRSTTGKNEHMIVNGIADSVGTSNVLGWGILSEVFPRFATETVKSCDRNLGERGVWHWVCGYIKASATAANCIERIWCDDLLAYERTAGQFNKWHTSSGWQTQTATDKPILLDTDQALDGFYIFTYWNGNSPQDQTCYIQDFVYHKEASTIPNVDEFGNKFIGSGSIV